jgi:hypothetical protein
MEQVLLVNLRTAIRKSIVKFNSVMNELHLKIKLSSFAVTKFPLPPPEVSNSIMFVLFPVQVPIIMSRPSAAA